MSYDKKRWTPKQQRLAWLIYENLRQPKPKTLGELLLEAGYSEYTSRMPSVIVKGRGFQEVIDAELPDDLIYSLLRRNATQERNVVASVLAIREAIKVKGQYAPPKLPEDPYQNMSDSELDKEIAKLEATRSKRIIGTTGVTEGEVLQDTTEPTTE